MRKVFAFILFLFMLLELKSQKYDYRWILGYPPWTNIDIMFTPNSADTLATNRNVDMENSQTTISDIDGNLQFYSNGAKVYTSTNSIMQNGDSINYGYMWDSWGGAFYNLFEDLMALPSDTPGIWNLFHYYFEFNLNVVLPEYPWRIYQTRIDMRRNTGIGEVMYKNKSVIQDTLGSYVIACRHANGRDWWLTASKTSSNCIYEELVQPDTVIDKGTQCIGGDYLSDDGGQAAFSTNGEKFAWMGGASGLNLYNFDRCSGVVSDPILFPFYANHDSGIVEYGLAFSPNSRFLYVAQSKYIIQLDTWANDIWASRDTVGYYQRPPDSTSFPGTYFLMQLAPDGKIYVSATNGIKWLHVINQPDLKGDSCNFVNYGFPLPTYNSHGLPSYPNYRLGALAGSPCDTLATLTTAIQADKEKILKVFPNPAQDFVIIDYGFTDWNKGPISLQVVNGSGQIEHEQKLPMYSGYQKVDVSRFAVGAYNAAIIRNNIIVAVTKFEKQSK
ncbi:MAG: hypothetical protein JWO06_268 [Bacteroidota bacterium]|nr:hypothetical protein [Bacteroidota bacterium]